MTTVTNDNMFKIAQVATGECIRQHVGLDRVSFLLAAYDWAIKQSEYRLPDEYDALHLAGVIEPDTGGRYRITPVTFQNGNTGAASNVIPSAMERLFSFVEPGMDVDAFVHSYLQTHPLGDGNGRTAFVLYNWLKGTLLDPEPLPHWDW